ncbi:MAG: DNA polymerase III subunit delta [Propionibacteriaceae bacterium]|nr:DNA polymerase III subunit delta [Propionibacteriaceae bacterium]
MAELRGVAPDAAVTTVAAADLSEGQLREMTGGDLFATAAIAVITGLEKLPKDLEEPLLAVARDLPETSALVVHHGGGVAGKKALDGLKKMAGLVIDCPTLTWQQWPSFVQSEAAAARGSIEAAAVPQLVEAVGQDTRALAAAVAQLVDDSPDGRVTAAQVGRSCAGRASVTGFAGADACLAGRTGDAVEKLRWALATGVSHPQITAALAGSLRQLGKYLAASRSHAGPGGMAAAVGAPAWKLRQIGEQARSWTEPAVAAAIRAVASADADVKGAAGDPDFALEQAVIKVAGWRGRR